MSNQLELRHYRYFQELAAECNFRRAAENLFISQPGLSRQIKQMEEILGVQLFLRNNRNVKLTSAGKYLQEELHILFNHLAKVEQQVKLIDSGQMGELRIGFLGSAMQTIIPQILVYLNTHHPKIHTTLEEISNRDQVESLLHDQLDFGFVRLPAVPDQLIKQDVHKDHFTLVLPKEHWLNKSNFKSINQVSKERFILFSSDYSPHYFETIISIFKEAGFSPEISHKSVHAQTIFKLVEQGLGIAVIPNSLQKGFDLGVKFLDIPNIKQTTTLSIIWNKENRNPCLPFMIQAINSII